MIFLLRRLLVTLCRFALPHKQQLLGLPAGQCIRVKATTTKGVELEQAFNPISTDDTPGEVVLLVKVTSCPQSLLTKSHYNGLHAAALTQASYLHA